MILTKHKHGHKGYRPQRWYGGSGHPRRFSNWQLLAVVALVVAGVSLLTWWLSYSIGGG